MFWSWLILKLPRFGHPEFEPCSLDSNHPRCMSSGWGKQACCHKLVAPRNLHLRGTLPWFAHVYRRPAVNLTQDFLFSNAGELNDIGITVLPLPLLQFSTFLGNSMEFVSSSRQLHGHGAACPCIVGNTAAACGEALYFWMWRGKLTNNLSRIKPSKGDDSVLFLANGGLVWSWDKLEPCPQMTQVWYSKLPISPMADVRTDDFVQHLRRQFLGRAYQCADCGYGPIDHFACGDLQAAQPIKNPQVI